MRFKLFSASRFQRAASPWIGLFIIGLWSLGCGGAASRGPDSGGDAQPAADSDARAAVVVVRDYLDALDEGDLVRAYSHWWAKHGLTFDEFQRQRANIKAVEANIGKPHYVHQSDNMKIPVELQITYKDDSRECAKGTYELRRAVAHGPPYAGGPGWFIASSNIKEC